MFVKNLNKCKALVLFNLEEVMGFYLNTQGESDENFLKKNGEKLERAPGWSLVPKDKVIVCFINGGLFVGAFVCDFEHELENCKKINLGGNQTWYLLDKRFILN